MSAQQAQWFSRTCETLADAIGKAVLGQADTVRLALLCLFAPGHLLLEDVPGTGKTSLARALAATVQGSMGRIQLTPDLLPSDLIGCGLPDPRTGELIFRPGPVFAHIVLADELNRASPKTQSALLEVMEEGRVTVDGISHEVLAPFLVIATQNPLHQVGTHRLPDSQLDRFLIRTALGHPDHETSVQILQSAQDGQDGGAGAVLRDRSHGLAPLITVRAIREMTQLAATVHVEPSVLEHVSRLLEETRLAPEVRSGVSIRGGLALLRAARVRAAMHGRHFVLPDDVRELLHAVWEHRLVLREDAELDGARAGEVLDRILEDLAPPRARRRSA